MMTMPEPPASAASPEQKRRIKAGRNLPAAIGTGIVLLVPALLGIFFIPPLLIAVWIVVLCLGVWEVARALETMPIDGGRRLRIPKVPLYLGAAAMPVAAYWGGVEALTLALMVTGAAVLVGAAVTRVDHPGHSITASIFIACWVPYLISFALLAAAVVVAGTAGDFSESMVKREIGLKDMSNVLPGHGGVMDRLDSIVFAMPTAFFVTVALTADSAGLPLGW